MLFKESENKVKNWEKGICITQLQQANNIKYRKTLSNQSEEHDLLEK